MSVCVFNVWPKTTLPLPVWSRDTKRWDTMEQDAVKCPWVTNTMRNVRAVLGDFVQKHRCT